MTVLTEYLLSVLGVFLQGSQIKLINNFLKPSSTEIASCSAVSFTFKELTTQE